MGEAIEGGMTMNLGFCHAGFCVVVLALTGCTGDPAAQSESGETETGSAATTGGEQTGSTGGTQAAVTYHRDVRPLLEAHCVGCHSDGNIAPFALTTYPEVEAVHEAVAVAVENRTMPPWHASDDCADYVGDPSLGAAQIQTVVDWVDGGAVEGDPAEYVAPDVADGGGLDRVDLTLSMPEAYTAEIVPDDYRCFLLDWPQTELAYVTGFRAVPGDLSVVHHVIAFGVPPTDVPAYEALDAAEPGPGYRCFGGPGNTEDPLAARWLGGWAPGGTGHNFPEGTGLRMDPGSKVVLQVHYNTLQEPVPDSTSIELEVDATVDKEAYMMLWANPDWLFGSMPIPGGESSVVHTWELDPTWVMSYQTDVIPDNTPILIHSVAHHMHQLGRRGTQAIMRSDGTEDCLVHLPRYDFNWQTAYRFAEPKLLEPGDSLRLECEWDNSAGGDVNWGEGTGDEMCLGILYITAP